MFEHDLEYQKRILREIKILRHFRGHENVVNLILPTLMLTSWLGCLFTWFNTTKKL